MGKAGRIKTPIDLTRDLGILQRKLFGLNRKNVSGASSVSFSGGKAIQITGGAAGSNLLTSNNTWTGNNIFQGSLFEVDSPTIFIGSVNSVLALPGKLIGDINTQNSQIHNLRDPTDCGDAVTLCYLNRVLQANGLGGVGISERIIQQTVQINPDEPGSLDPNYILRPTIQQTVVVTFG